MHRFFYVKFVKASIHPLPFLVAVVCRLSIISSFICIHYSSHPSIRSSTHTIIHPSWMSVYVIFINNMKFVMKSLLIDIFSYDFDKLSIFFLRAKKNLKKGFGEADASSFSGAADALLDQPTFRRLKSTLGCFHWLQRRLPFARINQEKETINHQYDEHLQHGWCGKWYNVLLLSIADVVSDTMSIYSVWLMWLVIQWAYTLWSRCGNWHVEHLISMTDVVGDTMSIYSV